MNDSRQSTLPANNFASGPPPNHVPYSGGSGHPVDNSWMTAPPNAGQPPLPPFGTIPNQNEFDSLRQGYHSGMSSPGPGGNGAPNFMHHSFIQQPYLNNKYNAAHDYNQSSHFGSNMYSSPLYANNFAAKVDSKQNVNSDGSDTHMSEGGGDTNATEGLTARLLDKNCDSGQTSPCSEANGNGSVGYRPWEQQEGQMASEQNASHQSHPSRPSSAQSDKQRTTPDASRRTGRSPSAQQFSDNHSVDRLSNQSNEKYQTLTPVPPIPPISAPSYNQTMYGQPPPVVYPNSFMQSQPLIPYSGGYSSTDSKSLKLGIAEPDSSTPDVRAAIENSFQVPSVSSTTSRQTIGTISQSSAPPPHPQNAQQVMAIHHVPQTVNEQWDAANQVSVPQNASQQQQQQQTNADGEKVTKKKRKRCGECPGCLKKDNCGECGPCKSVRSHQICKMRKCDQLKTKKEKVREAAQLAAAAAAAAASGMGLKSEITALEGSRNINGGTPGTTISQPFTPLGPVESHAGGVGPTPRSGYQDFTPSKHSGGINQMYDSSQTYANFHMNAQQMSGPFNGHGLVADVNRSHHSEDGTDSDNTHTNRHQMMNNRLKSLIQSRQTQKEMNSGQTHNSFNNSGPPQSQTSFPGQAFIVVQQSNANNSSLSPHYANTSGNVVTQSDSTQQSFMNWSQSGEHDDNLYHKNANNIQNEKVTIQGERRGHYNAIDMQNGLPYHQTYFARNSQENNTSTFTNDAQPNSNTNTQFNATPTYTTNQSQSYSSPNHEFASHESSASPANQVRTSNQDSTSFRPNSHSPPTRVSGNSVTKSIAGSNESIAGNGVNTSNSAVQNDDSSQPFLSITTTTMHHLSDLTTSMNTSTGIINSYDMSPSTPSTYYTSSLYMPQIGALGPSSPTVIVSVGSGLETAKKSLSDASQSGSGGHIMSGIDCGRINSSMMDISAYTAKSDLSIASTVPSSVTSLSASLRSSISSISPSQLLAQSSESQTSCASSTTTSTATTVLPPVSTFLLPNFRDHGWWDRLDGLKSSANKEGSDCDCYASDEREYNGSHSPSTLSTLPASLSN